METLPKNFLTVILTKNFTIQNTFCLPVKQTYFLILRSLQLCPKRRYFLQRRIKSSPHHNITFQWESECSRRRRRQKGQPIILRFARRSKKKQWHQQKKTKRRWWRWHEMPGNEDNYLLLVLITYCCYCNSETGMMMISRVINSRNCCLLGWRHICRIWGKSCVWGLLRIINLFLVQISRFELGIYPFQCSEHLLDLEINTFYVIMHHLKPLSHSISWDFICRTTLQLELP